MRTHPIPLVKILCLLLALLLGGALAAQAEDVVFAAPVDDIVPEAETTELWTEDIAEAVNAEEEADAAADKAALRINKANFPDAAFRKYVKREIDTNHDGKLSTRERRAVVEIFVSDMGISDLKGIEYFPALKELACDNNQLTSLNVRLNGSLTHLICSGNRLKKLDVRNNLALKDLECAGNKLTKLDVRMNSALTALNCCDNRIKTLDVSLNPSLDFLDCSFNKLTALNVRKNRKLINLYCSSNQITSLNLKKNKRLVDLRCQKNALSKLDLSANASLSMLLCHENQLQSLDVSANADLDYLDCSNNHLGSIQLGHKPKLTTLTAYGNALTNLDITDCPMLRIAAGTTPIEGYIEDDTVGFEGVYDGDWYIYLAVDQSTSVSAGGETLYQAPIPPRSIGFSRGSMTVRLGSKLTLKPVIKPKNATTTLTWSSEDKSVAKVNKKGVVTPVSKGTVAIHVKTANGLETFITVFVKGPEPESIAFVDAAPTVEVDKWITIKTNLTPTNADTTLVWESDDPSVATVNQLGMVSGIRTGTANITVTTANGRQATVKVTVIKNQVTYRALLVGQFDYDPDFADPVPTTSQNLHMMRDMLTHVNGAAGGEFTITTKRNLSYKGLRSAIKDTFEDADDNDESLIYFAGHGAANAADLNEGALCMVPSGFMSLGDFSGLLLNIPGKFFVFLDTCGSGTAVYQRGEAENGLAANRAAADFNAAVIDAFASIDPGILEDSHGNVVNIDNIAANVGDLRVRGKFYVLTAARRGESCWLNGNWHWFTHWLTEGIGIEGDMPADTNGNHYVTLNELFEYIKSVGDDFAIEDSEGNPHYQHVQVYPRQCHYALFMRENDG